MKNLKNIFFVVLAVTLIAGAMAFAETYRLGANKASFSPSALLSTTSTYTLTSADSQVEFTASSVQLMARLPKISDLSGVSKAFKIVKKDATTYKILIAPASGDTVGGESARYLLGDEDYIIVQSAGGKNWVVTYESPYLVENHAAGSYTTGVGSAGLYESVTATKTLTASSCGNIISIASPTTPITLPASVANCVFTIINTGPQGTGMVKIQLNASDSAYGMVLSRATTSWMTVAAGGTIGLSRTVANKGDNITLIGDGNSTWYIRSVATGTWVTPWAM